ncbi:MAG: hypothetical protein ACJAVK_003256 [Akkermansiaceae bacterium]|jgi:hypothetical protein
MLARRRDGLQLLLAIMRIFKRATLVIPCFANVMAGSIWVEGEDAAKQAVRENGWYASVDQKVLSGGSFLAHWGDEPGSAEYRVAIPEAGRHVLWLRANPVQAKLKVRVGGGDWMTPNLKAASHEQINIASDKKPDLRFVAWVRAGEVTLEKGATTVEVGFISGNHHHGLLDCFCLTTDQDWKPSQTWKPGESRPLWPLPELTDANLDRWIDFIRPSGTELGWRAVRWHRSLSEAAEEARKLKRPILLWAMNGHPCGET